MIELVVKRAGEMKTADRIIVATDDETIAIAVEAFGAEAMMTSKTHKSGTDRVAQVAREIGGDVIVNLQGDEPFIDPASVDMAVMALAQTPSVNTATLCVKVTRAEANNPDVTLVTRDLNSMALYFSKLPIPNDRDNAHCALPFLKHLGIYVYRRDFLLQYAQMEPTPLEKREKLEQLRILEHGGEIMLIETKHDSMSIDSPDDLEKANELFAKG